MINTQLLRLHNLVIIAAIAVVAHMIVSPFHAAVDQD